MERILCLLLMLLRLELSNVPSATYAYYFSHIKPKPQPVEKNKKGWVCKICGYVYEGEVPPQTLSARYVNMARKTLSHYHNF